MIIRAHIREHTAHAANQRLILARVKRWAAAHQCSRVEFDEVRQHADRGEDTGTQHGVVRGIAAVLWQGVSARKGRSENDNQTTTPIAH